MEKMSADIVITDIYYVYLFIYYLLNKNKNKKYFFCRIKYIFFC